MEDFEKLGVLYIGKEYDLEKSTLKDTLLLYDSKDLVTHAVCVGMTGSGKTGLCVSLIEEALIDGIPALVIDPKGDLCNLLLTFPDLKPEDFMPWINEEDARKKGLSPEAYAKKQAELWKKGLADWGQDSNRIRKLKDACEPVIYTPGSTAGIPLSILKSFEAPEQIIREDSDLLRERINTTVTSLLNLLGLEADPIQSREHILLSTILDSAWKQGESLDLAGFINAVQTPPVEKIGVFDLESFFPSKDRFSLAMKLNNLLAAPGFNTWLEGEPLDIDKMLYAQNGKPKLSIISIAHLNDAERMFFVSLLLTQVLGWMRKQSGTNSLRALLYMDEIFGYFPPVANPPSKAPLLTLLKQARAFGLGIVLATQNPVDLDYKGLSNTGTWFIGRLQTERDKERVLDGLEGAGSSEGGRFDRTRMSQILAGLGKRVFLMNNVHEDEPAIFHTRWVMSYLCGPLMRNQIKSLMSQKKISQGTKVQPVKPADPVRVSTKKTTQIPAAKPILPPGISQYFIPVRTDQPEGTSLIYEPLLAGMGKAYYSHAKAGLAIEKDISRLAEFPARSSRINWNESEEALLRDDEMETFIDDDALFAALPKAAGKKTNYTAWSKDLRDWIYRTQPLTLLKSPSLNIVSQPGEEERDFRVRLQMAAREKRDMLVERLRKKYAPKIARLEERIHTAERAVQREQEQAKQQKLQTAISFGATILSALIGRKKVSRTSLGRASTTVSRAGRILKEGKDIDRAEEKVEQLRKQVAELQTYLADETEQAKASIDPLLEKLEPFVVKPKKTDISVTFLALSWAPFWQDKKGALKRAW